MSLWCPWLQEERPCSRKEFKETQYITEIVKNNFNLMSECVKRQHVSSKIWRRKNNKVNKLISNYNKGLCRIWINFSRTADTMSSLKHTRMHLSDKSAALISEQSFQYLLGFDPCLADSFSQQVTVISAFFSFFRRQHWQRLVVGREEYLHVWRKG